MNEEKIQSNYYAIIPADVRYDGRLTANSKLLFGEITALCNKKGFCWATNKYFSELYDVDEKSISRWVKDLIDAGHISAEIRQEMGNARCLALSIKKRGAIPKKVLPLSTKIGVGMDKNVYTPLDKNVLHNNTSINNTVNTTSNKHPINIQFEMFWELYDKKVGRPKSERLWGGLSDADRDEIMKYVPKYKEAQPDKQYRKNPDTFLRNKCWKDELINKKTDGKKFGKTGSAHSDAELIEGLNRHLAQ